MTHIADKINTRMQDEARFIYRQSAMEGAALRGELGLETQLRAMSAQYKELKAAGKIDEANAIKTQAIKIING